MHVERFMVCRCFLLLDILSANIRLFFLQTFCNTCDLTVDFLFLLKRHEPQIHWKASSADRNPFALLLLIRSVLVFLLTIFNRPG